MRRLRLTLALALAWALPGTPHAEPEGVLRLHTPLQLEAAHERIRKGLESERLWILHESDAGERMARLKDRWGADYNRNGLGGIRTLVFCSLEWTNRLANADPDLLVLCPVHIALYERDGTTYVLLPRLSLLARGSLGEGSAAELEASIRAIVEDALEE